MTAEAKKSRANLPLRLNGRRWRTVLEVCALLCVLVSGGGWLAEPLVAAEVASGPAPVSVDERRRFPNVVLITVDTLRYDRLSINGYSRPTTPSIDLLLQRGVRFSQARVPEPLTAPSMCSLWTSLHPHEHGSTRNGLSLRPQLPSLAKVLARRGYKTAAFVGNWTLRNALSGLGEHFDTFEEVLSRRRWIFFAGEADAGDLNRQAVSWLEQHRAEDQRWPFLLWVHYVEPHAPYRFRAHLAESLGIAKGGDHSPSDRYDTEVAFVDRAVGELLSVVGRFSSPRDTMVVFLSDHGESLGEHSYWGHGRHLYEESLRVPMGITWQGRVKPVQVDALASSLDLAPTVLGLIGLPAVSSFRGYDWSGVLDGAEVPAGRVTWHQAHRGAVREGSAQARRRGLLAVGRVEGRAKETWRVRGDLRKLFDFQADPGESRSSVRLDSQPSQSLRDWLVLVREGLEASDDLPPPTISAEDLEQLRALGYID